MTEKKPSSPLRKAKLLRLGAALAAAAVVVLLALFKVFDFGDLSLPAVSPAVSGEDPAPLTIVSSVSETGETDSQPAPEPQTPGKLMVYFLDVGQGDSTLIQQYDEDGNVKNLLIDTGEYKYADGLTEMLRSLGVERLDAFLISHPHTDHMGCAARIVQRFEIGQVYMPKVIEEKVPTTAAYEALLNAVEDKGLSIIDLNQATDLSETSSWPFGSGLTMQVLAPRVGAGWQDLNNWSAVVRFTFGSVSFLFPGDAERDCLDIVREDVTEHGWELQSTVLKSSHHGSNDGNPSKWLKAVDPDYAVISCGKDNDYGHPHREPLQRFSDLDVTVYRTDQDGTILAVCDGETITWETGLPSVKAKGEN